MDNDTYNYHTTNIIPSQSVNTGLIRLEDGSLVEVEMPEYKGNERSAKVARPAFSEDSMLEEALQRIVQPVVRTAKRISRMENVEVSVEMEVGVSFEADGNVYITKGTSTSNLNIKLSIRQ